MYLFSGGARSMVLSFGLGLYLVLAPANKGISIFILLLTIASEKLMAEVETTRRCPLMPPELLKAAIKGSEQVLTEMLRLEEDGGHTSMTIESSGNDELNKYLQSATFMGNTVLHVLCYNGHGELASKVLKKDGSLLRARNKMFETPLHCAAKGVADDGDDAISALIEFARSEGGLILKEVLQDRNNHGETALHGVARHSYPIHEFILNKMLEGDPEWVYQVDNHGKSSLDVAMAKGYYDDVSEHMICHLNNQKILSKICCSPVNQVTALHTTLKSAKIAQKEKEMPTSVGIIGSSPIHIAASANNVHAVKVMLAIDVSPAYLQDSDGLFPVHMAARKGHVQMVFLFMQTCLDFFELVDHRERSFLHVAAEENKLNIFASLFDTHNIITNPFQNKILQRMMNTGDAEGNTPLHIAAGKGYISLMMMINNFMGGVSITAPVRNRKGLSAFDVSMIQVKAQAGNSLEIQDRIERYFQKDGGSEFELDWFENVMTIADEKSNGSSMTDQLQIIGLGAVLITTVAFAAAFTLPGGYGSNGSPVLEGKYLFKAFILAITSAFLQSFFCVLMLMIGGLSSIDRPARSIFLAIAMYLFSGGARSMVLSFGLGLYLVLAPANKGISIFILLLTIASVMLDITPKVLNFVVSLVNKIGDSKRDFEMIGQDLPVIVTFFGMFRFLLPFAFIFILAFLP
ncbi:hypothetical protein LUZ60_016691 [Juncus effusus]|nr:hypothetical protein LUZ60_016691 [Juncus effusus]